MASDDRDLVDHQEQIDRERRDARWEEGHGSDFRHDKRYRRRVDIFEEYRDREFYQMFRYDIVIYITPFTPTTCLNLTT